MWSNGVGAVCYMIMKNKYPAMDLYRTMFVNVCLGMAFRFVDMVQCMDMDQFLLLKKNID